MGGGQWEAKHVFVFRRLFLWREKEAEKRDESPSYICRGSLLLDAAEFLPTSISSLMKLQSPLPASMRSDTAAGVGGADGAVDLVGAINDALSVWDVVVRKQVSSPFAERADGIAPEGHRDRHVPKIPVNGVRSYEKIEAKIESKPCIAVHGDATPSIVQTVLKSDVTSDPSLNQPEGHCDIVNRNENDAKNTASRTSTSTFTIPSTSSVTPASASFSTSAFSVPALLLGAAVALGAMIVIRIRSR
jgi:HRDC domain